MAREESKERKGAKEKRRKGEKKKKEKEQALALEILARSLSRLKLDVGWPLEHVVDCTYG